VTIPRGATFFVKISGQTERDFYTYPLTKRAPEQANGVLAKLTAEGDQFQLLFPAQESEPDWKKGKILNNGQKDPSQLVHKKPFTWTQEVYVKPTAQPGKTELKLKVRTQVCNAGACYLEAHVIQIP